MPTPTKKAKTAAPGVVGQVRGFVSLLSMSDADMKNAESEYWAQVNEDYDERERRSAVEYPDEGAGE